jgi:hypothetical protein
MFMGLLVWKLVQCFKNDGETVLASWRMYLSHILNLIIFPEVSKADPSFLAPLISFKKF